MGRESLSAALVAWDWRRQRHSLPPVLALLRSVCSLNERQLRLRNLAMPRECQRSSGSSVGTRVTSRSMVRRTTFSSMFANAAPTHFGRICTNGIVCGSSDRSLLDYISVAVDCRGRAHVTYGSNTKREEHEQQVANNNNQNKFFTDVRVSNQVGGSRLARPVSCGV